MDIFKRTIFISKEIVFECRCKLLSLASFRPEGRTDGRMDAWQTDIKQALCALRLRDGGGGLALGSRSHLTSWLARRCSRSGGSYECYDDDALLCSAVVHSHPPEPIQLQSHVESLTTSKQLQQPASEARCRKCQQLHRQAGRHRSSQFPAP